MTGSPLLLLIVLAALVALPMVLRRIKGSAPDAVRVVGRTALHRSAVVAVVAVGERRLLVGAGERGVHLLAELEPAGQPAASLDAFGGHTTWTAHDVGSGPVTSTATDRLTTSMSPPGRMDAFDGTSLSGLELTPDLPSVGPRIGLVDRLRAMTVRTPVPGRPFRVPLRR